MSTQKGLDAMMRRVLLALLATAAFATITIVSTTVLIDRAARGRTYSDVRLIPHRRVGLLLGCVKRLPGGWPNPFFSNRIEAAAELYRAGKVDYLLVSGDNHVHSYDEANDMKTSLIEAGVPSRRIYCDYAGFRTLDSMVRAHDVFGQTEVTVISQEFHNRRAIFIARHRGLDAIGFNATDVSAYYSLKTHCREQLAKVDPVLDVYVLRRHPKFLGPKVTLGPSV